MKHLFSSWAISLFALFIIVPNSFAAKWKAEHVILIGLDGWGAYSVEKADISNIKKFNGERQLYFKETFYTPLFKCYKLGFHVHGSRSGTARLYRMGI